MYSLLCVYIRAISERKRKRRRYRFQANGSRPISERRRSVLYRVSAVLSYVLCYFQTIKCRLQTKIKPPKCVFVEYSVEEGELL